MSTSSDPSDTPYYDVSDFPGYGQVSGQKVEETHARHRVEVESYKRDPADFARSIERLDAWRVPHHGRRQDGQEHRQRTMVTMPACGREYTPISRPISTLSSVSSSVSGRPPAWIPRPRGSRSGFPSAPGGLDVPSPKVDASALERQRADHHLRIAPRDVTMRTDEPRTVVLLEDPASTGALQAGADPRVLAQRQRKDIRGVSLRLGLMVRKATSSTNFISVGNAGIG